jgi:hypothetical protein
MATENEQRRDELLSKFEESQLGLRDDKAYYDSLRRPEAIGIAVPPEMRALLAHVGYPRLYVDSLAERQEVEGFRMGGSDDADMKLWDWWTANNLDIEGTLGHTDAFVYGRAYITVSAPDPEFDGFVASDVPIIRVEPPTALYAVIDPRTRQVTDAIRAIYTEDQSELVSTTLYLPNETLQWVRKPSGQPYTGSYSGWSYKGDVVNRDYNWRLVSRVRHDLGVVPVIPLPNRTRLSDLYGTSEITPELRSVTDAAARIMMDMQGTAELMAIPQRLIFGVKPEDLGVNPDTGEKLYDAYMARILAFDDPDAKAQQFSAAELRNFVDALDALDRKAAAYTGLPPQYLSFSSENPASAEAIKSSESRLVKKVERKNRVFGGSWEQAMRIAHKVMNGDIPSEMYRMETVWADPSTPTYAAKADAAVKLFANGLGVVPKEQARLDMGYSITEREQMRRWDEEENPMGQLAQLYGPPRAVPAPPQERELPPDELVNG